MIERRFRQFRISPELVAMLGSGTYRVVSGGWPADAKIVRAGYDYNSDCFCVTLYHPSFPLTLEGCAIEMCEAPVIERLNAATEEPDHAPSRT